MDDKLPQPSDQHPVTIIHSQESSYDYLVDAPSVSNEDMQVDMNSNRRVLARQTGNSAQRGTQTITGQNIINDPATNNPVITTSGVKQNFLFANPKTKLNQISIGLNTDGSYSMKVVNPSLGIDVTKATNSQLVFNSNQDIFKIVSILTPTWNYTGVSTPSVGAGGTGVNAADHQSFDIAHGQTTIPSFEVYMNSSFFGSTNYIPIYNGAVYNSITGINNAFSAVGIVALGTWNIYANSTNIHIGIDTTYVVGPNNSANGWTATTINFKIFVLQETAN